MDLVWLSALTICLNLCINRSLGHLRGWRRLLQWPAIHVTTLVVHMLVVSAPVVTVLRWQQRYSGYSSADIDVWMCVGAALGAAFLVRRRLSRTLEARAPLT
jgi:hypothetical protein